MRGFGADGGAGVGFAGGGVAAAFAVDVVGGDDRTGRCGGGATVEAGAAAAVAEVAAMGVRW